MSALQFEHEEGETPFGIFHPTGYIIAAFKSKDAADAAARQLLDNNMDADKVRAVSPGKVQQAIEQAHPPDNLLEKLKQTLATSIGSEGYFWDQDLELAKQGAGFVTVYCGDAEQAHKVAEILKPLAPKTLRRYRHFAIEDLLQSPTPD